jgi:UDP-N-acetylglucosamine 2-epimerase (non-hydrolysing)
MNHSIKTILSVVGTRPNFMKVSPLEEVLKNRPHFKHLILHTGQHYDDNMSKVFFHDLQIRPADIHLGINGGTLGDQTGRIMTAFEPELLKIKPDLVVVVGDVNSTFAAAWVAIQNHFPVAHVESGLRSFDRRMPEEINRICTDVIADLLFTTHPIGTSQLLSEGVPNSKLFMVGDIMIDSLMQHRTQAEHRQTWERFDCQPGQYATLTLHRPSNVDDPKHLELLLGTLGQISQKLPIVFPAHPRTMTNLKKFNLLPMLKSYKQLHLCEPLSYLDFLSLVLKSRLVLTDSGGIQEETTFLNIPCMTLRENTERPFCVSDGSNYLVGTDRQKILSTVELILSGKQKQAKTMPAWDGKTAERIVTVIENFLGLS